ncbi:MAG TPA: 16S rRNA (uracil(1498)-N(3))-methyltransferase [Stellaceae bacterium]|jgi:16S rRNA (uracil1498-N3)-methyltransferase|nr:16S rRNA (uracil(1498)-N(3))-methyltransferase [Stellaceae bacterium]
MAYEPVTRLYVEASLGEGGSLGLAAPQAHYLKSVLRLGKGDELALFNGRDGEYRARIAGLGRGWCSLDILAQRRPQRDEGDLWLAFAPIKRARLDFLVEKATELGVSEIHPVMTARTMVARVNAERLRANAVEAAEQSERLSVPAVHEPVKLAPLLKAWPAGRRLILCDESGTAPPLAQALKGLSPAPCAILTGPEGGFADSELDDLRKLPFVCPVGLGPRVLRADTAALGALAAFQALVGDWSRDRPR